MVLIQTCALARPVLRPEIGATMPDPGTVAMLLLCFKKLLLTTDDKRHFCELHGEKMPKVVWPPEQLQVGTQACLPAPRPLSTRAPCIRPGRGSWTQRWPWGQWTTRWKELESALFPALGPGLHINYIIIIKNYIIMENWGVCNHIKSVKKASSQRFYSFWLFPDLSFVPASYGRPSCPPKKGKQTCLACSVLLWSIRPIFWKLCRKWWNFDN